MRASIRVASQLRASRARRRENGQWRPEEEAVFRGREHLQRVRRRPVHLACDQLRGARPAVRGLDTRAPAAGNRRRTQGSRPAPGRTRDRAASRVRAPLVDQDGHSVVESRREREEDVLLTNHRDQCAGEPEQCRPAHGPRCDARATSAHEQRHRERRAGVRKRRRDVHVKENRRARARRQGPNRFRPLRRGAALPQSRERWRRIHRTRTRTRPPRHTDVNTRRSPRRVRLACATRATASPTA